MNYTIIATIRVPVAEQIDGCDLAFESLWKEIEIPIPPFPGLHIGVHTVARVSVAQGVPRIHVDMVSLDSDRREHLREQGWR